MYPSLKPYSSKLDKKCRFCPEGGIDEKKHSQESEMVKAVKELESGISAEAVALNVPAGQWHAVRALESGSLILEMKEGAYEPIGPEDILAI